MSIFSIPNVERVVERFEHAKQISDRMLPSAMVGSHTSLRFLAEATLDSANCSYVLRAPEKELRAILSLAAEANAALVLASNEKTERIKTVINEKQCLIDALPITQRVAPESWIRTFFLCVVTEKIHLIDAICGVSPQSLSDGTGVKSLDYRFLLIDAIKSMWNDDSSASAKLVATIEAMEPNRDDVKMLEWTELLDLPIAQGLAYIHHVDSNFGLHLETSIGKHHKYWSIGDRRYDPLGYIAIELTGLAILAKECGLEFDVDSPYLPSCLLNVTTSKYFSRTTMSPQTKGLPLNQFSGATGEAGVPNASQHPFPPPSSRVSGDPWVHYIEHDATGSEILRFWFPQDPSSEQLIVDYEFLQPEINVDGAAVFLDDTDARDLIVNLFLKGCCGDYFDKRISTVSIKRLDSPDVTEVPY